MKGMTIFEIVREYETAYPLLPEEETREEFVKFVEGAQRDLIENLIQSPYSVHVRNSAEGR